jgi:hypothetical protein
MLRGVVTRDPSAAKFISALTRAAVVTLRLNQLHRPDKRIARQAQALELMHKPSVWVTMIVHCSSSGSGSGLSCERATSSS